MFRCSEASHLHGVPWFNKGADQVQVSGRFLDLLSLADGLVAGEQTPATSSEVGQHVSSSVREFLHESNHLHGDRPWPRSHTHPAHPDQTG